MGAIIPFERRKSVGISETGNRAIYASLLKLKDAGEITQKAVDCILKSFKDKELKEVSREKAEKVFAQVNFNYREIRTRAADLNFGNLTESILSLELELKFTSIAEHEEGECARRVHGRIISLFIE